jgi:subtilisin family serine protease/N-acetylneuraminic acid mutarotase
LRRLVAVASVLAMAVLTAGAVTAPASAAPSSKVDNQVLTEIAQNGSTRFFVYLKDQADLSKAAAQPSKAARTQYVYNQLTATAAKSQSGLAATLRQNGVSFQSFWLANVMAVSGDKSVVDALSARADVASIEAIKIRKIIEPAMTPADATIGAVEWGLTNIEAPRVWSELGVRGEGVVVANIDTGVQFNHPALVNKYRGSLGGDAFDHNYNWFDPSQVCGNPSTAPCDNNGHGTHTMGTMVGDDDAGNQVGVAPGARWIAAKGCESTNCSDAALLAAGQWVLAPTDLNGANPRPDLRPDIVNNSWGDDDGSNTFYQSTVRAWVAAGIMPVFSNGNNGPACDTAGAPASLPEAYGVGAYDISNNIAVFSSRGESPIDGAIKPNVSAPGVAVRSSVPGGGYGTANGTSMAAPHVSGAVALIWSAAPTLRGNITETMALLDNGATDVNATSCGGTADDNNNFGEGRLNAYQSVLAAPRGPVGRVVGTVTEAAGGAPIPGATVTDGSSSTVTGPDGRYALTVPVGSATITASKFGYASQSATVTVAEGAVVTQDFALVRQPNVTVSGRVLDGSGHGWPLYARIEVAGRPGGPIFTNPATGAYSFDVPGNTTYRVTTTALYPGYTPKTEDIAVAGGNLSRDITLTVAPACVAPGYAVNLSSPLLSETFDSGSIPAGWTTVRRNAGGAEWTFNDPGARGNLTGGAGGFAMADSDEVGAGTTTDTDLILPALDFTGRFAPTLRFNSDFRDTGSEDFTDVDVSTDGGTTWTNVYHQVDSRRGPRTEEVSLAAYAGQSNVMVRFHYFGTWDWWWEVDNLAVVDRSCDPVAGGLVVGFTTDANTSAALNGVTVTSDAAPADKGVSAATPDDPNIPDGFYWLFSSLTGARSFTATLSPYQPTTRSVTVAADNAVRADFALKASRLTVTPNRVESFQTLGQTRSTTVTVRNTGSAPAQVELFERGGDFTLLGARGAATQTVVVPGGVPKEMAPKGAYGITRPAGVPNVDDSWTQIDSTPIDISDNAGVWLDGKIYSVGGGSGTGNERAAFVFDATSGGWTELPDMPRDRSKPQAAALNGKLYVFGGWGVGGVPAPQVDVFDPAGGAWSTLAATNPLPRSAAGIAVVDGVAYLVGGCVDAGCTESDSTVRFDPAGSGSFSTVAPYPHTVSWMACGGISGRAYCAGGVAAAEFTDGFSYQPSSNTWTPIADMPVDLWASQEAAASGLLILAGGITNASSAITNRTIAYDPASNTWQDMPNANFPRARGAGACGVFKLGGWDGPFSPTPESEMLGGLDQCRDVAEIPWLTEDPASFTLAPGASRNVRITLAATTAAGVTQPGDYTAEIALRTNSPYPVDSIDVTMHVLPPATWGKITGTVQGQTCSGALVPVPAQIQINLVSNPDIGYSLLAARDGTYAIWLPRGRYDVIVSKDGWVAQVKRHQVQAGFVNTLDFTLRPFGGCNTRAGGV